MLKVECKIIVISCKEESYELKDGTKGLSHKVSFEQNGDVATLKCSKDSFDIMKNLRFKECLVQLQLNPNAQYVSQTMRIVSASLKGV